MIYTLGLDIGSTTIKSVVLDQAGTMVYKSYERHYSRVKEMALEKIEQLREVLHMKELKIAITGSAGLGIAKASGLDFVQEVFATAGAVKRMEPQTDVVIELGGEDAKIIFLQGALEERMNSTCAGGTGAFIDQMASLLHVDITELDKLSLEHTQIYPIASRCGVFAKTDIQPLVNQGADRCNIAASIFQAVVDQTIAGLAQGRPIKGEVLFLGGPLSFLKGLQARFIHTLGLSNREAHFPELGPYYIALGAAYYADTLQHTYRYDQLHALFTEVLQMKETTSALEPLFADEQSYTLFQNRHNASNVQYEQLNAYTGNAYLGIDAGSTTTKTVLLSEDNQILYSQYCNNAGNPLAAVRQQIADIYEQGGDRIQIRSSAVTGYGEELMKHAFRLDHGLVETIAHYTAAKHFNPQVDFILDIGGQDMKCFHIKDDTIDDILLNEACSSGCGSFIETFAHSLGYDAASFANIARYAKHPVDLGTRCTVFMNSSVKQAQKNGATVEDISAGLAMSVVKNALYKVIRVNNADVLGANIVVQGGTFLNDAVLRCFELELGRDVVRPTIAGLMGAFGAALYAKVNEGNSGSNVGIGRIDGHFSGSAILASHELEQFEHRSKAINCNGCTNHCHLTVNTFVGGKKYIAGNRCERPVTGNKAQSDIPNIAAYKYEKLSTYKGQMGSRGMIGIPLVLNMFENLPFWHTFFTSLGFHVVLSDRSSKSLYVKAQNTIPSDTVCYPAKLVHGHIHNLLEKGVKTIFYPCMSYNFDEHQSDNCFNCPVVAYYPEVIQANMDMGEGVKFLYPYLSLNDSKLAITRLTDHLKQAGYVVSKQEVAIAADAAYKHYESYKQDIRLQGQAAIQYARERHMNAIIVAGRPYHIDPEINHGIMKLLTSLNLVVLTEDCIPQAIVGEKVNVLNQWTYHARLYNAARYAVQNPGIELIQLVSFGCGLDAITSDEVRDLLRSGDKLYTQLKIDEIDNLGAVKIRIRSLLATLSERERSVYA